MPFEIFQPFSIHKYAEALKSLFDHIYIFLTNSKTFAQFEIGLPLATLQQVKMTVQN